MKGDLTTDRENLQRLISDIGTGAFVIPNFQRDFEWEPSHVRELIRSIFLDYYIGSLLLWKCKDENFDALACEPIYGFEGKSRRSKIVLDGQQRLTAMYFAFIGSTKPHPNRSHSYFYFVHVNQFMNNNYDDAFFYKYGQTGKKLLEDRIHQFKQNIFPLSVIGHKNNREMTDWLRGYENYWLEQVDIAKSEEDEEKILVAQRCAENANSFFDYILELFSYYNVSFIELDRDIEIDKVCDIFTQINSRGMRLDIFDLINALLTPKEIKLKEMYEEAKQELSFVGSGQMNVYLLQVMSILKQVYCSPKYLYYLIPDKKQKFQDHNEHPSPKFLFSNDSEFKQSWTEAVDSMKSVVNLLKKPSEYGAISSKYIPYTSILPPLAALNAWKKEIADLEQIDATEKIRSWYWISVFLERYSGSVHSTIAKDFIDVRKWIQNDLEPSFFTDAKKDIPNINLYKKTKRGAAVYKGVFNLFIKKDAKDWYTNTTPHFDDIDDHHIVPKSWGTKQIFKDGISIDTILNRTLLTPESNRKVIGNKLPNEYLPKLIEKYNEDTVRVILESHFISEKAFNVLMRPNFKMEDYEEFIEERQKTIRSAIVDATGIEKLF